MKALVDLNVILDVIENRTPWVNDSAEVCSILGGGQRARGVVSPHAITTVYYIARRKAGRKVAERAVDWMAALFDFAPCGKNEVQRARALSMNDFEDAVGAAGAEASRCDYIVTRNTTDFAGSPVPAVSPSEFLAMFNTTKDRKSRQ